MKRYGRLNDLAMMMIKQARLLKQGGLLTEARELARRALFLRACDRLALQPVPIRVKR